MTSTLTSEGKEERTALALSATVNSLPADCSREAVDDLVEDILALRNCQMAAALMASLVQKLNRWRTQ